MATVVRSVLRLAWSLAKEILGRALLVASLVLPALAMGMGAFMVTLAVAVADTKLTVTEQGKLRDRLGKIADSIVAALRRAPWLTVEQAPPPPGPP